MDNDISILDNLDTVFGKQSSAIVVAELAYRNKRAGGEPIEHMTSGGSGGQFLRERNMNGLGGFHDGAICSSNLGTERG